MKKELVPLLHPEWIVATSSGLAGKRMAFDWSPLSFTPYLRCSWSHWSDVYSFCVNRSVLHQMAGEATGVKLQYSRTGHSFNTQTYWTEGREQEPWLKGQIPDTLDGPTVLIYLLFTSYLMSVVLYLHGFMSGRRISVWRWKIKPQSEDLLNSTSESHAFEDFSL